MIDDTTIMHPAETGVPVTKVSKRRRPKPVTTQDDPWRRWAVGLAMTMIAAGIAVLAVFWMARDTAAQESAVQAENQSQQAVEHLHDNWASAPQESIPEDNESWATITIPAIGLEDEVVIEGTDAQQINVGVGHYIGTEFPWEGDGNVALAGHRTGWGQPFNELDELQLGDVVTTETAEATYTYTVTGSTVVDPTETWVLKDLPADVTGAREGAPTLTLTTCEGSENEERLIVWAELTDVDATASA